MERLKKNRWQQKYDKVIGYESLIEPPRTAELYKKTNVSRVLHFGYTCKRIGWS